MKPFTFRLESILALRAREEAHAEEAFGQLLRAHAAIEAELASARLGLEACEHIISRERQHSTRSGDQLILIGAWSVQRDLCEQTLTRLAVAENEVAKARETLIEARRRRAAIERSKERQQQQHADAVRRHEEAEIADFITSRFVFNSSRAVA